MVIRALSKELQQLAITDLNENPDTIEHHIKIIREWAQTQSHLRIQTEEQWLLSFLRGCKFNLERVKQRLTVLYTMRSRTPEWFANRDPFLPEIQELLNLGLWVPLRRSSDPRAPFVILCRESEDSLNFKLNDRVKLGFMMLDILMYEDDNFVIAGAAMIGDGRNVNIKHVVQLRPRNVKRCIKISFQGYPVRSKACHALNTPSFVITAFHTLKHFVNKKLWNRVHFYKKGQIENLYKHMPVSILPEEYGGSGGSLKDLTAEWKQKVESYRNWFLGEDYVFDEKGRSEDSDFFEESVNIDTID